VSPAEAVSAAGHQPSDPTPNAAANPSLDDYDDANPLNPSHNPEPNIIHILVEYLEPTRPRKYMTATKATDEPPHKAVVSDESSPPSFAAAAASSVDSPVSATAEVDSSMMAEVRLSSKSSMGSPASSLVDVSHETAPGARRKLAQNDNIRQDLLAVFTPAAAARVGGQNNIKSQIQQAVLMANKAYADSGIPVTLFLLDMRQVSTCTHVSVSVMLWNYQCYMTTLLVG
jgi:hypothetical protein